MKKILEFNYPEDEDIFDLANRGIDYYGVLVDYDDYLRGLIKYKSKEELKNFSPEIARKQLNDFLKDRNLELNVIHN